MPDGRQTLGSLLQQPPKGPTGPLPRSLGATRPRPMTLGEMVKAAVMGGFLGMPAPYENDPQYERSAAVGQGLSLVAPFAMALGSKALKAYPLAKSWHGDMNYAQTGGRIVEMSPDEFLKMSRPLKIDELSRENIDLLKQHIQAKGELDPLALYGNGLEDGRHRAIAAKELGIDKVPVLTWRKP